MNVSLEAKNTVIKAVKPKTKLRYVPVLMASVAIITSYINRVNISVAAPELMKTFHISASQMGVLMSAFFWAYMAMMVPGGALLNKFGPRKVLGYFNLAWGFVSAVTCWATGFGYLLACRIGVGAVQAPGFPAAARIVSVWVPKCERSFATACFDSCARLGSAMTVPIVAFIIIHWGWRTSFVITGLLAIIWSIYVIIGYREPDEHPKLTSEEKDWIRQDEIINDRGEVESKPIPMLKLFSYPVVLKTSIAYAMFLYVWTVFSNWMPAYLMNERGLSLRSTGFLAIIPYLTAVVAELVGGIIFDWWYRKGATITKIRRTGLAITMLGSAIFIYLTMKATSASMAVVSLTCFMILFGFGSSNTWAVPSDIAPYGQAGGVAGIYSFIGNFGAALAPMVTGFLVDSSWGYNGAFVICVIAGLVGAFLYISSSYERLVPKTTD